MTAPPTATVEPIQASSPCASTPSSSISIRNRRGSSQSRAPSSASRASDAREISDTAPIVPRSTAPSPSASRSRSARPTWALIASEKSPRTGRPETSREKKRTVIGSSTRTVSVIARPSGNSTSSRRLSSSYRVTSVWSSPMFLALTMRSRSSTRKKRRFSRTPCRSTRTRSTWRRRVPLTGVTERHATCTTPSLRGSRLLRPVAIELPVAALEVEQLLVAALLDHLAVLEHDDSGGVPDRREPVGDHDRRATGKQPPQALLDQRLGVDVDVRSGLVEDEDAGIGDQRSRKG